MFHDRNPLANSDADKQGRFREKKTTVEEEEAEEEAEEEGEEDDLFSANNVERKMKKKEATDEGAGCMLSYKGIILFISLITSPPLSLKKYINKNPIFSNNPIFYGIYVLIIWCLLVAAGFSRDP